MKNVDVLLRDVLIAVETNLSVLLILVFVWILLIRDSSSRTMGDIRRMKPVRFKVKYKLDINGFKSEGIEEEASWFYLDQRGKFYSDGPMSPIRPCGSDYEELIPLLKINNEYLTIDEIEKKMNDLQKFHDMFIKHNITDEETSLPNREL